MSRFIKILFFAASVLAVGTSGRAAGPDSPLAPLTRDAFVATLAGHLVSHFNLEGDLQLELLRPWSAPSRLAREWTVEVQEFPSLMASSLLTRCRLLADGELAGEYTLTLRASLWRDAWAARQPVPANQTFDAALLEARRVDFLRERDALPSAVGDGAFMFARSVQANRLLTWRDISRRALVRKGDLVDVAVIDGMLQVTMRGLAMENGAKGDTVTIRNPESKKDFAAQVIAENRVQIRF
jgi:flagella basal body P-ring formation protein FlgA